MMAKAAELVQDLNPFDTERLEGFPQPFAVYNDELYVAAFGPDGQDLFKSDGTGIFPVADTNPGGDSVPYAFTEFADELIFWCLWRNRI